CNWGFGCGSVVLTWSDSVPRPVTWRYRSTRSSTPSTTMKPSSRATGLTRSSRKPPVPAKTIGIPRSRQNRENRLNARSTASAPTMCRYARGTSADAANAARFWELRDRSASEPLGVQLQLRPQERATDARAELVDELLVCCRRDEIGNVETRAAPWRSPAARHVEDVGGRDRVDQQKPAFERQERHQRRDGRHQDVGSHGWSASYQGGPLAGTTPRSRRLPAEVDAWSYGARCQASQTAPPSSASPRPTTSAAP